MGMGQGSHEQGIMGPSSYASWPSLRRSRAASGQDHPSRGTEPGVGLTGSIPCTHIHTHIGAHTRMHAHTQRGALPPHTHTADLQATVQCARTLESEPTVACTCQGDKER